MSSIKEALGPPLYRNFSPLAPPHKQREFPIVALSSIWRNWNGYRYSVLLDRDGLEHTLAVNWLESVWSPNHRFAAIRNSA